MKIEITKKGTKDYYEEFLYIMSKYKKIRNNPKKKVHSIVKVLVSYIVIDILVLSLFTIFCFNSDYIIYPIVTGILGTILTFLLFYLYTYKRKVKEFISCTDKKTIVFNNIGVEYISDKMIVKLNWKNIKYIIFYKNSIVCLPKNINDILISINSNYKQQVLEGIKKYKKEYLVIDNK